VTACPMCAVSASVQVLRSYIEAGKPLEAAFSRARSFSKKLKRSGGVFVPRGEGRPGTARDAAEEDGEEAGEEVEAGEGGEGEQAGRGPAARAPGGAGRAAPPGAGE
jgi:hypothetical protein